MNAKKITVIGSGYVGTTTAALLAHAGYDVYALDVDQKKVDSINNGKSPFYEKYLTELISAAVDANNLRATTSYKEAVSNSSVVISCVGTPDNADGSSNLTYVLSAAKEAAQYLDKDAVYVQKSTVPVGTGRTVAGLLPETVAYVSNPEFLREGTAIYDTLLFDRIVVGGDSSEAVEKVVDLYKQLESHTKTISLIATDVTEDLIKDHVGNYIQTTLESAELIKVTANAFLALKISFANSIAQLCDETNADVTGVMDGIGSDARIGRSFLNAGRGYGGGCFPKDVSGLISSALEYGVDMPIMVAATKVNEAMPGYIVSKTERELGPLKGSQVAVLGLAFKSGTSDARKSPAVKIANLLAKAGARVSAYDPEAAEEASHDLAKSVIITSSIEEATKDCDYVFVATDWPELRKVTNLSLGESVKALVDCMNCIDKDSLPTHVSYVGVGR